MKMVLRQPDLEQVMVTPAYYRDKLTQKNSTTRATYNIGFTLDILPKQLVLNGNASLLNYDYQREKFNKALSDPDHYYTGNNPSGRSVGAKISAGSIECFLTYTGTFAEKHNLEAMIGGEYYTYNQFDFEAKTQGSPTDDVPTLNVGSNRTFTRTEKTNLSHIVWIWSY